MKGESFIRKRVGNRRNEGRREIERRGEELIGRERRIGESKYDKWYRWVKGKGIPKYLKKGYLKGERGKAERGRDVWRGKEM